MRYAIAVSIELENGEKYDTTVLQNLTDDAINSGITRLGSASSARSTQTITARRCCTAWPTIPLDI
jgi:hypothetical protein